MARKRKNAVLSHNGLPAPGAARLVARSDAPARLPAVPAGVPEAAATVLRTACELLWRSYLCYRIARSPGAVPEAGAVIVGGESGPNHRPFGLGLGLRHPDRCVERQVALRFKQIGGLTSKAGGRLPDGRTWDDYRTSGAAGVAGA
ncbi:DUF5131 family protein [Streptomyces sp. NPDC001231]|uniref:DUF5131 family protein n=1 Tax=unclassified Streptomyces TaxID=2593676 RepID=UPI00368A46CF